jgi:hypothetical protein|nr:MAG TPA: hypothetical protein [Bacteriophage sp.]
MKENKIHITLQYKPKDFDINMIANKLKENLQKTFEPLKHKTIKEANAIIKKGFKNKLPLTSEWKVTIHNDSSR